ncbi:stage V sporulation protein S [Priestia megaterium]|uniref:stage V sporulation protein S n=1 Tax=Priestia megaterium TaxID=1404 RepID=UPI002E20B325|nr:stage V sporulation protein S [Priestia megaterium]MED4292382.1 stage V sporulation protein S [Priestia megaterium]MED4297744.1 stage V sporulation protein S [Priestia megaterium]
MDTILRVSSISNPNSVAGAITVVFRERGNVEIQVMGAGALNQAIKAVATARGFVAPSGVDLICVPGFRNLSIDNEERTGITLILRPRKKR